MALGVLRAVQALEAPVLVGSTAVAPYSLSQLVEEDMAVSLGSHFFIGAWAMVLLYDYHNGIDFADYGGAKQSIDYLSIINSENAFRYYDMVYKNAESMDFSVFSLFLHSSSRGYSFSLIPLMYKE